LHVSRPPRHPPSSPPRRSSDLGRALLGGLCIRIELRAIRDRRLVTRLLCELGRGLGIRAFLRRASHAVARRLFACLSGRERRARSEEHTSELQSLTNLVCRLLL